MPQQPYELPPDDEVLNADPRGKMIAAGEAIVMAAAAHDVSRNAICRAWGWNISTGKRYAARYTHWLREMQIAPPDDDTDDGNEHQVFGPGGQLLFSSYEPRIRTLEDLVAAANIDLDYWEVTRQVVNNWEVTMKFPPNRVHTDNNYQVKAWLQPRQIKPFEDALRELVGEIAAAAPKVKRNYKKAKGPGYLAVVQIPDTHVNKRSLDESWTVDAAAEMFKLAGLAIADEMRRSGRGVSEIVFLIGNDSLHADNFQGTTTGGTVLETVSHQERAIRAMIDALIYVIDELRDIAPVDVVTVGGNHDAYSSLFMAFVLEAHYRQTQGVTVDTSAAPRKYRRFGETLLGFYHGDKIKPQKLAMVMMAEAGRDMGETSHWEWLQGHRHGRSEMTETVTEEAGVLVRFSPALCPPDKWHSAGGFLGNKRGAELLWYSKKYGPKGSWPVFVDELREMAR